MRKLSLLTLTIFFAQNLFSQGTWTQLTDLPGSGRHHACSFVIGDSAYIATGSGTDDFFRYDIHNDSWIQLPNFPGGNRNYAIGFSINGKGYISCGYDGSVSNMEIWEFDPTTAIWTQKTSGLPLEEFILLFLLLEIACTSVKDNKMEHGRTSLIGMNTTPQRIHGRQKQLS